VRKAYLLLVEGRKNMVDFGHRAWEEAIIIV